MHTPSIISRGQANDGHIFITIRCCDDPSTDQSHSYVVTGATTPEALQAWAEEKKAAVAAQHAAMQAALEALHFL